ncbi:MAG TPA: hypothetical protein VE959_26755 [Bryobacteraceae bacterium]|nr:hypothetical protein [Bryobacteraceae bacterium]
MQFDWRPKMTVLSVVLLCAVPVVALAQPVDSLDLSGKLRFHVETLYSPLSMAGSAAYAGILQGIGTPEEWGQGAGAYGKRFASTVGCTAIYEVLAFGLDSTLHQDPRYFRSSSTGFWRRTAHALRGTILTRTDHGGETLSIWRLGSSYGAAYLSNQWYPDRLNTVRLDVLQGSLGLGFGFASNLGAEFWPDLKRKILRRRQ